MLHSKVQASEPSGSEGGLLNLFMYFYASNKEPHFGWPFHTLRPSFELGGTFVGVSFVLCSVLFSF